jgi:hypothetical protein
MMSLPQPLRSAPTASTPSATRMLRESQVRTASCGGRPQLRYTKEVHLDGEAVKRLQNGIVGSGPIDFPEGEQFIPTQMIR